MWLFADKQPSDVNDMYVGEGEKLQVHRTVNERHPDSLGFERYSRWHADCLLALSL